MVLRLSQCVQHCFRSALLRISQRLGERNHTLVIQRFDKRNQLLAELFLDVRHGLLTRFAIRTALTLPPRLVFGFSGLSVHVHILTISRCGHVRDRLRTLLIKRIGFRLRLLDRRLLRFSIIVGTVTIVLLRLLVVVESPIGEVWHHTFFRHIQRTLRSYRLLTVGTRCSVFSIHECNARQHP